MTYKDKTFCSLTDCAKYDTCDRGLSAKEVLVVSTGGYQVMWASFKECYKAPASCFSCTFCNDLECSMTGRDITIDDSTCEDYELWD